MKVKINNKNLLIVLAIGVIVAVIYFYYSFTYTNYDYIVTPVSQSDPSQGGGVTELSFVAERDYLSGVSLFSKRSYFVSDWQYKKISYHLRITRTDRSQEEIEGKINVYDFPVNDYYTLAVPPRLIGKGDKVHLKFAPDGEPVIGYFHILNQDDSTDDLVNAPKIQYRERVRDVINQGVQNIKDRDSKFFSVYRTLIISIIVLIIVFSLIDIEKKESKQIKKRKQKRTR